MFIMKKGLLILIIICLTLYSKAQFSISLNPEAGINNTYLLGDNTSVWLKGGDIGFASGFNTFAEYNFESENLKIGAGVGFQYQPIYYVIEDNNYSAGKHKADFYFIRTPIYLSKSICDKLYFIIGINLKFVLQELSDSTEFLLAIPNDAKIKKLNAELAIGLNYTLCRNLDFTIKTYIEMPGFIYERRPEKLIFANYNIMTGLSYKFNIK